MALKILIIEDDPSFIVEVEMMISDAGDYIISKARSIVEAKEKLEGKIDLILLDLRLEEGHLGIELLEDINQLAIPFVVITAFKDPKLYEISKTFNPEAYLVKPFDKLTLIGIIDRLFPGEDVDTVKYSSNGIFVKANKQHKKILFGEIEYIKAEGNYCSIFIKGQSRVTIRNSIKGLIDRMPPKHFLRVHRSYIVNLKSITSVEFANNLIHIDKESIPIGRNFKKELKNNLMLN